MRKLFIVAAASMLAIANAAVSFGSEREFYRGIEGQWSGPGEIVAGKFKGTKFNCTFNGSPEGNRTGMLIDGSCRVGVFNQPMNASVIRTSAGYSGKFLDGEAGEGMDVVGGRFSGSHLLVDVRRKDLDGVMSARLAGKDKLNITVSVKVDSRLIPVIGMSLDRIGDNADRTVTSSIKK